MNIPLIFVIAITVITIGLGIASTRKSKTASDFFVAGRSVNAFWNASAISGEYLSAASFMGVAGLLMKFGYDVLWYPVCYAAGYLFLLLFIAGPLRRFGAYTIPDFAEGRFDSPLFRRIAVTFVLFIGFFYTMPQMKAAGVTINSILGWPYYAGVAIVGVVITFNVALGGMKGITLVQAFQYWVKVFAISVPVFVLMSIYGFYTSSMSTVQVSGSLVPRIENPVSINFKGAKDAPANAVSFSTAGPTNLALTNATVIAKVTSTRKAEPGEDPLSPEALMVDIPGDKASRRSIVTGTNIVLEKGTRVRATPVEVTRGGKRVMKDGKPVKTSAKIEFRDATTAELRRGAMVPNAQNNKKWIEPFGTFTSKWGFPLLYTYSLIIALICGTAGLPHILVRFYTNPDGRAAKRTTLLVMVMLGCFYVFTPIWGALGRLHAPELYANNSTDQLLIRLPMGLENELLGQILTGITSAGAFAAFMSTFSGLLVSMSGAMAHDIYGKILRPKSSPAERLAAFKVAAMLFGAIAVGLGCLVENFDINVMVGWAFAIAAASYFPLLLLGSWWRGLTKYGAAAGMLSGGLLSLAAIVTHMLIEKKLLVLDLPPIIRQLLEQPAIWGVPLSLTVMILVSRATSHKIPEDASLKMLRLHAPEELGLSKNYIEH